MQLSDVEDTYHSYHTARLHMHMRTDLERRVPSNSPVLHTQSSSYAIVKLHPNIWMLRCGR